MIMPNTIPLIAAMTTTSPMNVSVFFGPSIELITGMFGGENPFCAKDREPNATAVSGRARLVAFAQ